MKLTAVLMYQVRQEEARSINLAHAHTVNSHTHTTKDHTLTVDEMPSHLDIRSVSAYGGTLPDYFGGSTADYGITSGEWNGDGGYNLYSSYVGGNKAHNHGETSASSPGTNSKLSTSQSILKSIYNCIYLEKSFIV